MEYIGICWKCGAEMYRDDTGRVVSEPREPECLCEVRLRDLLLDDSYNISLTKEEIAKLEEGDYVEVEAVIQDILSRIREQVYESS